MTKKNTPLNHMTKKNISLEAPDNKNIFRFLHKSYDESISLLVHARDYFTAQGKLDKSTLPMEQKIAYTLALSTITTQLTSVVSWLMFCKAIEAGEVAPHQIKADDLTMPEFNSDIHENGSYLSMLNSKTLEIIERSGNLYNRIKRMESPIREQLMELA